MENLESADKKLSLLVEPRLKMALEDYVYKGDAQVIPPLRDALHTVTVSLLSPSMT